MVIGFLLVPGALGALGNTMTSVINVLHSIANAILQYLLSFTVWFRDTILSDPWRAAHFMGSTVILMMP